MGSPGPSGPDGAPGSRVLVTPVPSGSTCASGGTRIDVGIDVNRNGLLDPSEVQQTATVCSTGTVDAGTLVPDATSPDSGPDCGMHGTLAGSYLLQVHQVTSTVYDESCQAVVDTYDGPSTMVLTPYSLCFYDDPNQTEPCRNVLQFAVSLAGADFAPYQMDNLWDPANTPNVVTLSSSGFLPRGTFPETSGSVSFTIDLTSGVVTDVVMQSDSHGLSCHEQRVRVTGSGARDCTPAPPVRPGGP